MFDGIGITDAVEEFFDQLLSFLEVTYEYLTDEQLQSALLAIYNALPFPVRIVITLGVLFVLGLILIKGLRR